ncbi:MAG TPA: PAS domain S-box protein, partial [bacterium]
MELSEKQFEELYSKAGILYFLLDPQANILSCNATTEEKLDFDRKDWMGRKFLSLISEENVANIQNALQLCYHRGYIKEIETSLIGSQDRNVLVRLNGLAQSDANGNLEYVRLVAQDVTEMESHRKRKTFLLDLLSKMQSGKDADRTMKEILNAIQIHADSQGIGLFLRERNGQPLNLVTWDDSDIGSPYENDYRKWHSEAWQKIIRAVEGCASAHFTPSGSFWTESLSDLILEASGMEEKEAWMSLSAFESIGAVQIPEPSGQNSVLVIAHRSKKRWNDDDIRFIEAVSSVFGNWRQDRKESPQPPGTALIDALMDVPFVGILILRDGRIERGNSWVCEWTRFSMQELQGKPAIDLLAPECSPTFKDWADRIGDLGSGHYGKELVVVASDGTRRSAYAAVSRTAENGVRRETWYWTPKPEQADIHEQLMHAKRMEYLGMLSGSLVLDFNNLLSCILGYTSLLSEEIPKDSPHY